MKALAILALVAGAALAGDVLKLTKDNIDKTIEGDLVLVKFFAPWCGHCKSLAPEYEKAATELLKNDPPVVLAEVDCTEEKAVAERFKVSGYPTLKIFRKGVESEYNGPRDADGIVKYMAGQSGAAAKPLATEEAITKFLAQKSDVNFVAYTKAGSKFEEKFVALAEQLREEFRFGLVNDEALVKKLKDGKECAVLYRYVDGEEKELTTDAATTATTTAMKTWLFKNSVNFAGLWKSDYAKRYEEVGLPRLMVWAHVDPKFNPSGARYYLNRMRKGAADFKGKLVLALGDREDKDYNEMQYTVKDDKSACIGLIYEGARYKGDCEFSVDAVKKFAQDFLDGKLEKYIKSDPIPEKNDEATRVIVGKTFDDEVMKTDKDVMLLFYAPWCGHCKSLHPKYDELAEKFSASKDVLTIAKFDATTNDPTSDKFEVHGFPTMYFVKANDKKNPIEYRGERDVESMEKFIKQHTTKKLVKKEL